MKHIKLAILAVLLVSVVHLSAQSQRQRNNFGGGGGMAGGMNGGMRGGMGMGSGSSGSAIIASNFPANDFRHFYFVVQNNVFNGNRYPNMPPQTNPVARVTVRPPAYELLSLVGTLTYEKGTFAFFNGSSSAFKKTVGPDGTIAGYQITEIAKESVTLVVSNEPPITLRTGQQMRRDQGGSWRVLGSSEYSPSTPAPTPETTSSTTSTTTSSDSTTSESSASEETDPVLKRLMEKRRLEQEGK